MLLRGRMPIVGDVKASWYDTPNIHLCTIRIKLCDDLGLKVQQALSVSRAGSARRLNSAGAAANICGEKRFSCLPENNAQRQCEL